MRSFWFLFLILTSTAWAQSLGNSVAKFGFDYYRNSDSGKANYACSPLSIHSAFSMLALGAKGESAAETFKVLRLTPGYDKRYPLFIKSLRTSPETFFLASNLWLASDLKVEKNYLSACQSAFGATPQTVNFSKADEISKQINTWVKEKTAQKIKEILPSGAIDAATRLVLVNSLYFKGDWKNQFDSEQTVKQAFTTPTGVVKVDMMKSKAPVKYAKKANVEMVSLAYSKGELAMAFILPDTLADFDKIRAEMDESYLADLENSGFASEDSNAENLELSLPKFKVMVKSEPRNILDKMGLKKLLSQEPELGGISTSEKLQVSECFHQAFVAVNESGTEASASTAVVVTRAKPQKRLSFDRPFYFVLYHRISLAPLIIGQVVDPQK